MAFGIYVRGISSSAKALDGDVRKVECIDPSPDGGVSLGPFDTLKMHAGRHVLTDSVPTKVKWAAIGGKPIPDFDPAVALSVSVKAKDIIEKVEPNVHQFCEVDYFNSSGTHTARRFFLVVGNRIDSISRESPGYYLSKGMFWRPTYDGVRRGEFSIDNYDDRPPKILINSAAIEGVHLWVDKHMSGSPYYVSEALAAAITDASLTGIEFYPVEEI